MTPIDHHTLLSDRKSLALVDPSGAIVWLCAPRPDAPPIFGSILDPEAGVFAIDAGDDASQRYVDDTMVCHTRFEGLELFDYLDRTREGSRLVRAVEGNGRITLRFAPRLDLGRQTTTLSLEGDAVVVNGGALRLTATPPVTFRIEDDEARAELEVDERQVFELHIGCEDDATPEPERRAAVAETWRDYVSALELPDVATEHVARSALTLAALVYEPTGAIVAAASCSLPESIGGPRNWDYRFCWPRDAAYAAKALTRLGDYETGAALMDWIGERTGDLDRADMLEPLYTVDGARLEGEETRDELAGYADSQPVRIGNGAAGQVQLDVFGPVVDLAATLAEGGYEVDTDLVTRMLDAIVRAWDRPGHGIWELRAAERHHVYSRGMCWLALTRGAALVDDGDRYLEVAEKIRGQVETRGWSESVGAYTMAYDQPHLDAAVLALVGTGFFTDAERERRTVDAIDAGLRSGPVVFRYHMDDGLDGDEGGFFITSFWLVDALAKTGRTDRARALFDELLALTGPLGLYAEEYDPKSGLSLGNFPQAYSHLAQIDSAFILLGE